MWVNASALSNECLNEEVGEGRCQKEKDLISPPSTCKGCMLLLVGVLSKYFHNMHALIQF